MLFKSKINRSIVRPNLTAVTLCNTIYKILLMNKTQQLIVKRILYCVIKIIVSNYISKVE